MSASKSKYVVSLVLDGSAVCDNKGHMVQQHVWADSSDEAVSIFSKIDRVVFHAGRNPGATIEAMAW